MKKLLGAALIAGSLLIHGCKEDKKTNTFNTHVPDLHAVLSMKIQDSDAKEFKAYENVMDEYYLGTNYMSKDPSLASYVVDFKEILPLYIKESRLDPSKKSKSGAEGVSQMRDIAFDDVKQTVGDVTYNKIPNKRKNIVCSMIYYSHIKNVVKEKTGISDSANLIHFTYAAYNLGITNFCTLYEKAGKPQHWEGFVDEVTDILGISDSHRDIIDPDYNVAHYTDRFGDKKFDGNKQYSIGDNGTTVSGNKLKETVRYVELTDAIGQVLNNSEGSIYATVQVGTDGPYKSILSYFVDLQNKGVMKEGNTGSLIHYILVDNGISNHSPYLARDTIEIDDTLIAPYLIDKDIQKFEYKKIPYTQGHYYWSIFQEVLDGNSYADVLDVRQSNIYKSSIEEKDTEDDGEGISFDVKQTIDEAIIYFNYARRSNYDLKNNEYVLLPSTEFIDWYDEHRESLAPIVSKLITKDIGGDDIGESDKPIDVASGSIYANPAFDAFADRILPAPKEKVNVTLFFNPKLKRFIDKNGVGKPTYIILHHTGNMYNEEKKAYHNINAHFYIDREGNIYESSAIKGNNTHGKIVLGNIGKLNHAGEGLGRYGAIRNGDDQITYKAIGIEIENGESNGDKNLTQAQYTALTKLLGTLSSTYHIPEKNILTHSMVAVTGRGLGKHKYLLRGRKEDPRGLEYSKIGMKTDPFAHLDKDVINGTVQSNIAYIVRDRGGNNIQKKKAIIDRMTYGLRVSSQKAIKKKR